jgi:hypothetical protein
MDSKGRITEGSARELGRLVKWYRGLPRNKAGKAVAPVVIDDHGPWLGIAQANIANNRSGPVNFLVGPKGQETDSGVTVQVYNRFANLSTDGGVVEGSILLFYAIDGGYEALKQPTAIIRPSTPLTPCRTNQINPNVLSCTQCQPLSEPISTCSQKSQASFHYLISGWDRTLNLTACCSAFNGSQTVLAYVSSCTWESSTFVCGSAAATKWQLVIGETFTTLTWLIDDSHSVVYQARTDEFSAVCGGMLKLISAKTSQTCSLPCYVCITASSILCACSFAPPAWQVTISGLGNGQVAGYHCLDFNGTFEIPFWGRPVGDCLYRFFFPDNLGQIEIDMSNVFNATQQQYTIFLQIYLGTGQLGYDYVLRGVTEPKGTPCHSSYTLALDSSDPCGNAPKSVTITAI